MGVNFGFGPELEFDMVGEAAKELMNPVLHRIEVEGLSSDNSEFLSLIQEGQLGYTKHAGRRFRHKEMFYNEVEYNSLQFRWNRFGLEASPEECQKALNMRGRIWNRSRGSALKMVKDIERIISCPDDPWRYECTYASLVDGYLDVLGGLEQGVAELFPIAEIPFPIQYAISARKINSVFHNIDWGRSWISEEEYFRIAEAREPSLERVNASDFPYKQNHLMLRGSFSKGVADAKGLMEWFSDEMSDLYAMITLGRR
jgi:hypothetical protein